jgi:hypothetical protein
LCPARDCFGARGLAKQTAVPPMLLLSRNKSYRPHRFLQICGFVRKKHGINYFIQPLIEFSFK